LQSNLKSSGWHKAQGATSILSEFKRDRTAPVPPSYELNSKRLGSAAVPWEAGRQLSKASPETIHSFWSVGSGLDFGAEGTKYWFWGTKQRKCKRGDMKGARRGTGTRDGVRGTRRCS